ncbi:MAG TPA: tryptophan--tRNA ligase [Patescibacteria group bacterium]|nr:tryptophan--tRNA ligase [Patescibacteria group bacterium]
MQKRRVLTGIKPTGSPHLGNYVGAIKPAIEASRDANVDSYFFLADYHALISTQDPLRVQRSTLEIAATWLALGLDPERVMFYRQSDIPEIPELTWLLTCVTGKGLLNRAHAYKAAVDANAAEGVDVDAGISAGLYMYPVLMAADILMFNAHAVPVGKDQVQHIEIARDLGQRFNHIYGSDHFTLPEARVDENTATLAGLDGRKMSKSYDNTIPLWDEPTTMRKLVMSIVTNSQAPGEPKDADASHVFSIYQAFATPVEAAAMRRAYQDGISWGDAKQALFERIDRDLAPARERYRHYMANPQDVEALLLRGAERAREESRPFIARLRDAVGLRAVTHVTTVAAATVTHAAEALQPELKQYRESDGQFHFKLAEKSAGVLAQSIGFANGKDAGAVIARIKRGEAAIANGELVLDGAAVAYVPDVVDPADASAALDVLVRLEAEAQAKKQAQA